MAPKRCRRRAVDADADRGSTLVIVLVVVVLAALVVVPMLDFGSTLLRFERVASAKTNRIEAVKGALRVALADPAGLYQRDCPTYNPMWTPSTGLELVDTRASGDDVRTGCELMGTAVADFGGRLANAFTAVGVAVPEGTTGSTYVTPDAASISTWFDAEHASSEPAEGKIWLPQLPVRTAIERTEVNGWAMPADYGNCRVFFPGTYRSAITLTGGEVYFASGTYYFEAPLTIDGTVDVVVGEGTTSGCATDQEAAFDALAPPDEHGINGLGATFVFGGAGRLVLNTQQIPSSADVEQTVVFNQRYVAQDDVGLRSSHRVSIMTVNGTRTGPTTVGDLLVPNDFHAPLSTVAGATPGSILSHGYEPSTRLAVAPRTGDSITTSPVIKITYGHQSSSVLRVAGYVAIPQGFVDVGNAVPADGSMVAFDGGMVAAAAIEHPVAEPSMTQATSKKCAAPVTLGPDVFTASVTVPGYDSTLGTLLSAQVSFTGEASFTNTVTTAATGWKADRNDHLGVFVTGPGMAALPPESFLPAPAFPGFPNVPLPPVPAGLSGAVLLNSWSSGVQNVGSYTNTGKRSVSGSVTVTSNLAMFAAPAVTLSANTLNLWSVTLGVNGTWTMKTQTTITPCVTYNYTSDSIRLLSISLQTPVVQKILLLTAVTTNGSPQAVSRVKVQVNANGAYEVNSWTVE